MLYSNLVALACAAFAAGRAVGPIAEAPMGYTPISPVLLGDVSDPGSVVLSQISLQTNSIATLAETEGATAAVERLEQLRTSSEPIERLSASVISRAAAGQHSPGLERGVGVETIGRLRSTIGTSAPKAVAAEPAAALFFDGAGAAPALDVDGLRLKGEKLYDGDKKAEFIGAGEFGRVFGHPTIDGAVAKVLSYSFEVMMFTTVRPKETMDEEKETSEALAKAGAGPRYFGSANVAAGKKATRPFSVKERLYGKTVQSLVYDRQFGAEEYQLVMEMLDRMADAGIQVDDMRLPNIMIGRTKLDPIRRAYLVDGGKLMDTSQLSRDELRASLQTQPIVTGARMDTQLVFTKPFDYLLKDGLERSAEKGWWKRFKRGFAEAFNNAALHMPNR